jgi:hypothetical protein
MVDAMKRTFSHVGFASIWIFDEFCVVVEALWNPFFKLWLGMLFLWKLFFLWWWVWKVFLDTMNVWSTWPSCFVCLKLAILWADYHVKIIHRNICSSIIMYYAELSLTGHKNCLHNSCLMTTSDQALFSLTTCGNIMFNSSSWDWTSS